MQSSEKKVILVVDDASKTREVLQRNLAEKKHIVYTASGVPEAIKVLESTKIDIVITDYKMQKITGLDLIKHVHQNYDDIKIMMITGYPTIEGAVSAIKAGADEFLGKPFTDEELSNAVNKIIEKLDRHRLTKLKNVNFDSNVSGIVAESESMKQVNGLIEKAGKVSTTVLITGESGTGKDLVARAIHNASNKSYAPFIPVNCGGIPEQLLESELFGHVKGSFTGAVENREGYFQTANGGTIFLDEVSEMSISMQVKLLRVLQSKEISVVGSSKTIKVNTRVIAATNKELSTLVKKNLFREDLFFRLNVLTVNIPALRDRGAEDILLLINHFTKKFTAELGKSEMTFSDEALRILANYFWPGNVRELENLMQRLVIMTDRNVVEVSDLPSHMRFSVRQTASMNLTLAEVENEHIRNVLASTSGNKTHAAEILGIDRKTLREKLKHMTAPSDEISAF